VHLQSEDLFIIREQAPIIFHLFYLPFSLELILNDLYEYASKYDPLFMKKIFLSYLLLIINQNCFSQDIPDTEVFTVLKKDQPGGPHITPLLQNQTTLAWKQDDLRRKRLESILDEQSLLALRKETKDKLLEMIGGLPKEKTPLNAHITGRIEMKGFHIEKLLFESIPGFHVTALVYVPEDGKEKHPVVLVACGHSVIGKIYYQGLCQRLVQRGYLVICWDPVGQAERSQFWDAAKNKSRYNLVCGEHAVLGNLAYLAGTNLIRWQIWDGIRALDYMLTRPDADASRVTITGTSGGGVQSAHIAALDDRIKVVAPSCYISSLPMRAYNRIFEDPDSDPEQDLYGMIANGVDHTGLLLLIYPRPLFIASAVLDFFPIEGTRKTFREISEVYTRFGHGERIAMVEGYHKHQFSLENQEAVLNFLDRFNDMPLREELPPVTQLDEATLKCTRTGQVLLDFQQDKKLTDLIREYFLTQGKRKVPTVQEMYYGNGYPGIKNWEVVPYSSHSIPEKIAWQKTGSHESNGITIDQYLLHHSNGLQIPLLYFQSRSSRTKGKTLLWLDLNEKAGQKNWTQISKLVNEGKSVISFDFRGTGEDQMLYETTSSDRLNFDHMDPALRYFDPLSSVFACYIYNTLLTGRPYFLQMMEDTEIVARFARDHLNAGNLSFTATGETTLLAYEIAKTFSEIKPESNADINGITWSGLVKEARELWSIHNLLPGAAYIR
jgi:dienelactone hydrolase